MNKPGKKKKKEKAVKDDNVGVAKILIEPYVG